MIERDPQHRPLYIYVIRADHEFYPLSLTLAEHDRRFNRMTPVAAHREAALMGTHIVARWIHPENIQGYRAVTYNNHGIVDNHTIYDNHNYISMDTVANDSYYQAGIAVTARRFAGTLRSLAIPMFSACLIASGLGRDELRNHWGTWDPWYAFSSYLYFFPSADAFE